MSFLFAKLFLVHRFTKEPTTLPENVLSTVKTDFLVSVFAFVNFSWQIARFPFRYK